MVIDTGNKTIKVSSMGKIIEIPYSVIDHLAWAMSSDKKFVVMVVDNSKAKIDGDTVIINDGANCMSYSIEFLGKMMSEWLLRING